MLNSEKANKIAKILDKKAKENADHYNVTYEDGLKMAVKRMIKEYPIAAMAFALS